jgi:16S rRNA (adenine1518-N6/adenine1519-N6)-dimethyltransferase
MTTEWRDPRSVLKAHDLWAKKRFGQNFLVDRGAPERIVRAGGATAADTVFEIGPGVGTLTRALANFAGRVVALEYDRDLVPVARAELVDAPHVEVRAGDVRDVDWDALAAELGGPLVVYGNIPYHLSTDIVLGLVEHPAAWRRACFLLQLEFAERMATPPGEKGCGAPSAAVALHTEPRIAFRVGRGAFHPPPNVDSAVLVLQRRERPAEDVGDPRVFRQIVAALFGQRRKTARNALRALTPDADALLERAGLDPQRRGETFRLARVTRWFGTAECSRRRTRCDPWWCVLGTTARTARTTSTRRRRRARRPGRTSPPRGSCPWSARRRPLRLARPSRRRLSPGEASCSRRRRRGSRGPSC